MYHKRQWGVLRHSLIVFTAFLLSLTAFADMRVENGTLYSDVEGRQGPPGPQGPPGGVEGLTNLIMELVPPVVTNLFEGMYLPVA
jgi:hypothetical protein